MPNELDKIMTKILNSKLNAARRSLRENQEEAEEFKRRLSLANEAIKYNELEIAAIINAMDKLGVVEEMPKFADLSTIPHNY